MGITAGITAQCLHGAKVCIIPRPENGFKPLALHRRPLAVVAGILLLTKALALGTVALMPLPAELSTITSARIVELTNQERAKQGLNRLKVNTALTEAARQKAQNMLDEDYFAHISPSGVTPWFWMSKVNYSYQVAGENLAIDFVEAEKVVAAWMASPTHKENILHEDYIETGVAVLTGEFEGGTSTVVVHMFGLPEGAQAPVHEPEPTVEPKPSVAPATDTGGEEEKSAPSVAPPAVPDVIILDEGKIVKNGIELQISGNPGDTVTILVNSQARVKRELDAMGLTKLRVTISDIPDGEVTVKALAQNSIGASSDYSAGQVVTKDTQEPQVAKESLAFIVSPATDEPVALLDIMEADYSQLGLAAGEARSMYTANDTVVVSLDEPITLVLSDLVGNTKVISDLVLAPSFYTERDAVYMVNTARLTGWVRRVALVVIAVIVFLLVLAIVIRINIQHPRMIAHASLVVLLALIMLFL